MEPYTKCTQLKQLTEALQRIVDDVKESRDDVVNCHREVTVELDHALQDELNITAEYSAIDDAITAQLTKAITRLTQEADDLRTKLKAAKVAQLTTVQDHKMKLQSVLGSQQEVLELVDTTLATQQNASLLNSLHSGIRDSLHAYSAHDDNIMSRPYTASAEAEFVPKTENSYCNILGFISKRDIRTHRRHGNVMASSPEALTLQHSGTNLDFLKIP